MDQSSYFQASGTSIFMVQQILSLAFCILKQENKLIWNLPSFVVINVLFFLHFNLIQ